MLREEEDPTRCYLVFFYTYEIPLENTTLYALQFADDQAVLAGNKEDLEYMTRKLKETCEKWGLDMNLNKTKYLHIGETTHNNLKLD
jgi:hypothetical protein